MEKKNDQTLSQLVRYAKKLCKTYDIQFIESGQSFYIKKVGNSLRISNHIGTTSDGVMSLIVPQGIGQEGIILLHIKMTGGIKAITIQQARSIIMSFVIASDAMEQLPFSYDVVHQIKDQENIIKTSANGETTIMGYPLDFFTEGQINHIKFMIGQQKRKK